MPRGVRAGACDGFVAAVLPSPMESGRCLLHSLSPVSRSRLLVRTLLSEKAANSSLQSPFFCLKTSEYCSKTVCPDIRARRCVGSSRLVLPAVRRVCLADCGSPSSECLLRGSLVRTSAAHSIPEFYILRSIYLIINLLYRIIGGIGLAVAASAFDPSARRSSLPCRFGPGGGSLAEASACPFFASENPPSGAPGGTGSAVLSVADKMVHL